MKKYIYLILLSLLSISWVWAQSPGGVTGASLWLRADAGTNTTTNGGTITAWNDQSGNNKNFANASGTTIYQTAVGNSKFNFNPSLYISTSTTALSSASSLFSGAGASGATLFGLTDQTNGYLLRVSNNAEPFNSQKYNYPALLPVGLAARKVGGTTLVPGLPVPTAPFGTSRIASGTLVGGTSYGIAQNGSAYNMLTNDYETNLGPMVIGSVLWAGGNEATTAGNIPEVIAYTTNLTSVQLQQVNSYLAIKYGITLDQTTAQNYLASDGTTVTWNATTNSGYANNIAGIGRDNLTALNQKQSCSVNASTSQVVMALGTAAATNQANANTFASDKQFFIWSDNNGSLTTLASTGNSNYPYRFTRVWKTQNTNSFAQDITVYYPVSAFGNAQASTVSLLYGSSAASLSNGTALTIAQSGTTSINGVVHYIFTVPAGQIANMQFFSFTGTQTAPGGVLGTSLWLKADAGTNTTTNNASVTSWTDANGLASSSGTGATYQSLGDNFNPGILFGGSGTNSFQYPTTTSFGMGGTNSFNVFATTKTSTNGRTYLQAANSGSAPQFWNNGAVHTLSTFAASAIVTGTKTVTDGKIHILGTNRAGTAFANNFDGGSDGSSTNSVSFATGTTAYVGNTSNNALPFNGNINELIVYGNASLTALQQQRVNSYLAIKYGVTLDPQNYLASDGTTIWWDSATNAGYNNNIAGIAKDDASALNQKQSQSVNSGIQPVIGNINITDTNANNTNNFTVDKSALVWGSDTGSTNFATSFVFGGLNNRMTRIWRVQQTGTVGIVKVAIPASQISGNISPLNLVVSADAIFDGSDTRTLMTLETLGSVQYYTATVNFTSGQYFTFAGFVASPGGVLNGLTRWHKADAGVTTATGVSVWVDQSSATTISQATAANQPVYNTTANLINFNSTITFDGSNDNLTNSITGLPQGAAASTFYFVDRPTASNTSRYAFGYGATSGTASFQAGPAGTFTTKQGGGSAFASQTNAYTVNIPSITRTGYDGTRAYLSHNAATEVLSTVYTQNVSTNAFAIGARSDGAANFFTGDIPEVIAYGGKSTASELIRIESYLAIKYGITKTGDYQNSSSAVIWDATANTGYNNNIAGIMRDNASALHQKVSRSVNSGTILTIATNADFASANSAGTRTNITNDLSSLVIGDDNGTVTRVTTNLASGFNTRITRIWRVQATNYTQAVSLQFNGLDTSNFTWNLVYKAADANFTAGSTTLGTLNSNGQITLASAPGSGFLSLQAVGIDSDGDGVLNVDDLDDDNDGIQDVDEVTCANLFTNGTFNGGTTGWTINSPWEYRASIPNTILQGTASTGQTVSQTVNFGTPVSGSNFIWSLDYTNVNFGAFQENEFRINGVLYALVTSAAGTTVDVTTYNGATVNVTSFPPGPSTTTFQKLIFTIPSSGISGNMLVSVSSNTNGADGDDVYIKNMYIVNDFCDTDSDGVPNRLDLDSDNDGCLDAIDGDASVIASQLVTAVGTVTVGTGSTASNQNLGNTVNANGIPQLVSVPYNYSNTTGQGIGASQTASISGCAAPGGVLNGLTRWHKADAGVTTATGVSAWVDQSSATTISQATAANQPVYNTTANLINFNSTITFDGSNDDLLNNISGLPQGATASTFYFVDRPTASNTSRYAFGYGATSGTASFQAGPAGTFTTKQGGGSAFASQTNAYTVNIPSITRTGYDGTRAYLSHNAATEVLSTVYTQNVSTNAFAIGARSDGAANFFTGDIPEVIAYGGKSTASELIRIESYLAIKYGITKTGDYQNSSSAVIWDATANTGYNNNIAGIMRDDASALSQKQSQSVNSGLQPVIGNVNITGTNANNTNNFSADLSALVWGSDTGSTSFATSFVFGGLTARMARIWRVQETGTVGTVKVALPVSQVQGNAAQLNLVVSADATIDGSDTRTAMTLETLGGVQYYTATVDFTTGQFFTFAALATAPGGVFANLRIWLKADDGFTPSSWADRSGNSNDFTQTNASRQPNLIAAGTKYNFNPTVNFGTTGSDARFMVVPSGRPFTANGLDGTFLLTINQNTNSGFRDYLGFGGTTTGSGLTNANDPVFTSNDNGNRTFRIFPYSGATSTTNLQLTAGITYISDVTWRVGVAGGITYGLNGFNGSSGNTFTAGNSLGFNGGILGAQPEVSDAFMSEVIAYERALTAAEMQRVRTYLSIKYGTTLDQSTAQNYLASDGTTIFWNATTNAAYKNNIAGIGRDDTSTLNQKQSQSINSGTQVVIGNGSIAASNAANTNNFSADLSALVWGSDTGSTSFATSFVFGGLNNRMARIWKMQKTGTVGTVKVALPASQIGSIGQLSLVTSSDATFDGTDTRTLMTLETIGSVQYYTATVDVTTLTQPFFTFAGLITAPGGVSNGLTLWMNPDAGINNDANISTWTDRVNNVVIPRKNTNTTLSIQTALNFNRVVNMPTSTYNGFELPATDSNIGLYDPSAVNGMSVFGAGVQSTSWNDFAPLISKTNGGSWASGWVMSTTNISGSNWGLLYVWGDSSGTGVGNSAVTASGSLTRGNAFVASGWWDPAVTNKNNVDLNAVSTGSINVSTTTSVGSPLGIGYAQGYAFGGQLGDQIYYNRSLSATERARVQSYLSIKFGTTLGNTALPFSYLNSSGNTIWAADATYQNNIFGIARDDASALHQRISKSVNSGSVLTVSTDTNFTNENSTHAAIGTNLQSLVLGETTGAYAFTGTSISASGATFSTTEAMGRRWKVQDTGGISCVNLRFDAASLPALSGNERYYLIISDNAGFTSNVVYKAVTRTGNTIDASVNFRDNNVSYFTLAKKDLGLSSGDLTNVKAGINTIPSSSWQPTQPNTYLEINSNAKGLVVSRVASTAAIVTPLEGMIIYDLSDNTMKVYTGTIWRRLGDYSTDPALNRFCN